MERKYIYEKVKKNIEILNKGLVEREEIISLAILAILSKENILLIGPPGTAKSEISRRVSSVIEKKKYFEYLLTKFTTPEEIFGPISIKNLENDIFKRVINGYMPDSHITFLDEIFKANSSILNALLTLLNEKIYHNGNNIEKSNLISIIASSNEIPLNEEELQALYDRFILKLTVEYVNDLKELVFIDEDDYNEKNIKKFTLKEIEEINNLSKNEKISDEIVEKIIKIKQEIEKEYENSNEVINEKISDRKFVKTIKLLKLVSFLNNKDEITIDDLIVLKNIFWSDPKNINRVKTIIINNICLTGKNYDKKINMIYNSWEENFEEIFKIQEKDSNGNLLYLDINGEKTTEVKGKIHLKDEFGDFLFFKGHREYIKIAKQLSSWDHDYEDTGIITIDGRKIWKYEFSNIQIIKTNKNNVEGYEKLFEIGKLKPLLLSGYNEFIKKNLKLSEDKKEKLETITINIKKEYKIVFEKYNEISKIYNEIKKYIYNNLFIVEKDKDYVIKKIENNKKNIELIVEKYNKLLEKINMVKK
ncbi:MoxR-like ATPase [Hypnocyclicus thermotrophus]|uniref:MoxR-like ATPase n=1 Tax=Hypnocyclicus thermotrophus TaxID=1627895 RepID=A0AA46DZT0_9FUSO|nr:AAA family ATPase [Hypnocyclicus thermotrophus]TDT71935.1 MoxR-like ATPase [Hypnocyclicus thermotrophus]